MRKLMTTDRSKCAISKVLRHAWIIEHRGLHNSSWKNYFVSGRIVVRLSGVKLDPTLWFGMFSDNERTTNVDCVGRHNPLITIGGFA